MNLTSELIDFVAPLAEGLATPDGVAALLVDLGLVADRRDMVAVPAEIEVLAGTVDDALDTLLALQGDDLTAAERALRAVEAVRGLLAAVQGLAAIADTPLDAQGYPFDSPTTWTELAAGLPGYLLMRWLRGSHPTAGALLRLGRVVVPNGRGGEKLDFSALGALLEDPGGAVGGWVAATPADLWTPLAELFAAVGAARPAGAVHVPVDVEYSGPPPAEPTVRAPGFAARFAGLSDALPWSLRLDVAERRDGPGVALVAGLDGATELDASLPGLWKLAVGFPAGQTAAIELTPDGPAPSADGGLDRLELSLTGVPDAPWLLLGSAGATRLELASLMLEIAAEGLTSAPELEVGVETSGLKLVLALAGEDAFLADVIGSGEVSADLSLDARWSSSSGFVFAGSAGIDVTVPVERSIGPVSFETLTLRATFEHDGVTLEVGATVGLALGPIDIVIEGLGLTASLQTAAEPGRGTFGELDFVLGFKPPTGLGLAIDVGVVEGGGFISHDPDLKRYAGAAELRILGTGLTVVGVLLTELPGEPGSWSMFLSLSIRLTGVQLGFGFTLNGVGGLAGIHRGLDDEALGEAVRSGSLDSILFPEDAVASATQILGDIDAIFPPARDQYVFGPVVKIGWGTPTLIELDVGVAIQLPEPLSLTLIGLLNAVLPDKAAPILTLKAAIAGTVNFTEGTLKVDASLSGSQVAGLAITGDMAVRMEFLAQPSFLISFGGFHPGFDPPASFPKLERLGISLDTGDVLAVALGGYFAVSSNSLQFGAFAEFRIREAGFSAEGGTTFDALIIFRPFSFTIGLSFWVSVSAGNAELLSVMIVGELRGPNPWNVAVEASFKLLLVKTTIDLELSFGDRESQAAAEALDVQQFLDEALALADAWSVVEPPGDVPVLFAATGSGSYVDPAGRVQVSQRIVPLDRVIDKYGDGILDGVDSFSVRALDFSADEVADVQEWFGTEHYFTLSEEERLSAPSFDLMKAGLLLGGEGVAAPAPRTMSYDHEIAYKDPNAETPRFTAVSSGVHGFESALAARRPTSQTRIRVSVERYVLAEPATGQFDASVDGMDFFAARSAALEAEAERVVVPAYEAEWTR